MKAVRVYHAARQCGRLAARRRRAVEHAGDRLNGQSPERFAPYLVPFRQGLSATGYADVTELVGMTADGPFLSRPG